MSAICHELHALLNSLPRQRVPPDPATVPDSGVYVLFEKGEVGHGGDRVVRIGSHTGEGNLRARLREHFINENKDRSIFRKNVGRAFLNRDRDPFLSQWEWDLTTREQKERYGQLLDWKKQRAVEHRVSEYIWSALCFVIVRIDSRAERLNSEKHLIATIAQCTERGPSDHWLGRFSPVEKIRDSGLWEVQHLRARPLTVAGLARIRVLATKSTP